MPLPWLLGTHVPGTNSQVGYGLGHQAEGTLLGHR